MARRAAAWSRSPAHGTGTGTIPGSRRPGLAPAPSPAPRSRSWSWWWLRRSAWCVRAREVGGTAGMPRAGCCCRSSGNARNADRAVTRMRLGGGVRAAGFGIGWRRGRGLRHRAAAARSPRSPRSTGGRLRRSRAGGRRERVRWSLRVKSGTLHPRPHVRFHQVQTCCVSVDHPRKDPRCYGRTDHDCSPCRGGPRAYRVLRFDLSLNCLDGGIYLFQRFFSTAFGFHVILWPPLRPFRNRQSMAAGPDRGAVSLHRQEQGRRACGNGAVHGHRAPRIDQQGNGSGASPASVRRPRRAALPVL
jgi:hypothetical protein